MTQTRKETKEAFVKARGLVTKAYARIFFALIEQQGAEETMLWQEYQENLKCFRTGE